MERLEEKLIAAWERIKRCVDDALTGTTEDEREWDAITADCLMQIILFDEIVYG